jgi:hypothetical protein
MLWFITSIEGNTIEIECNEEDSILDIKKKIENKENIDCERQILLINQEEINFGRLQDYEYNYSNPLIMYLKKIVFCVKINILITGHL